MPDLKVPGLSLGLVLVRSLLFCNCLGVLCQLVTTTAEEEKVKQSADKLRKATCRVRCADCVPGPGESEGEIHPS